MNTALRHLADKRQSTPGLKYNLKVSINFADLSETLGLYTIRSAGIDMERRAVTPNVGTMIPISTKPFIELKDLPMDRTCCDFCNLPFFKWSGPHPYDYPVRLPVSHLSSPEIAVKCFAKLSPIQTSV